MPLLVLPAAEAFKQVRNADARWPRTAEAQAERLMPIAKPSFQPSFKIAKDELIFTIGSCFARNIEKQLILEGYNVAAARFEPPEVRGFKADPDALTNRYVVFSILNEIRWGLGHGKPFRDRNYVRLGGDAWFDPHMHPLAPPAPFEEVRRLREAVSGYMAEAGRAQVVIMTLGMAEAWFDKETGFYLNGVLPARARQLYPERFEFHLLDYAQILEGLNQIRKLLLMYGQPGLKMLVTVSPVAINTTFTGGEVLVANTYSKAVQRAAVEAFVRAHDNVDYFPSYESVVLSDRRRAWREDQAHASDEIVRLNVLRMIEAYAESEGEEAVRAAQVADAFALVQAAREAAGLDAPDEAIAAYRMAVAAGPDEGHILLEFGRYLYEQRAYDEAAEMILASTRRGSGPYAGFYYLAQVYAAAERYAEAYEAAARAREFQPTRPGVLGLSANICRQLKRHEEALAFAEAHLAIEPDSKGARRICEAIREEMEAKPASLSDLLRSGFSRRKARQSADG